MGSWTLTQILVFIAPIVLVAIGVAIWLMMRRTIRTRLEMDTQLKLDSEINEWLVLFGWTSKIIYAPTVILSLLFFLLSMIGIHPAAMGPVWLTVFLLNFLIEEYDVGMKELLIFLLFGTGVVIWLTFLGWLTPFFDSLGGVDAQMNGLAYLVFAMIFLVAITVSWVRGLFNYVAITPNYINIQKGPTESGLQISREEYSTIIDTSDLLERMIGFGKIIISFRDPHRAPLSLLVWGIGRKARKLESIRGTITIEGRSRPDQFA
jgi:hypothetical protein